jgi:hypothetical protein
VHFFSADMSSLPLETPIMPLIPSVIPVKEVTKLSDLLGRVSFVYTGALPLLFDESMQHAISLRLALLLRTDKPAAIFGRHHALPVASYIDDHMSR